ncbi:formyl transferase [Patescibacteria group bacterium]|nr:formyl transferase [Patescibacteria group bacterium]
MKILYLKGNNQESDKLEEFLSKDNNEVVSCAEKISYDFALQIKPDIIISYNYYFILKNDIISIPKLGIINLHISFLPWNKGADPNFWSHVEGTPKGVTIHYINEGVDTGDIVAQKKVVFSNNDTLSTSYVKLHKEIQNLFCEIWQKIKSGKNDRKKQVGEGTSHLMKNRIAFEYLLKKGWDTSLSELQLNLNHNSIHKKP